MFLIVTHSSLLTRQSKVFLTSVGDTVKMINEQTTCHQAISESVSDLKVCPHSCLKSTQHGPVFTTLCITHRLRCDCVRHIQRLCFYQKPLAMGQVFVMAFSCFIKCFGTVLPWAETEILTYEKESKNTNGHMKFFLTSGQSI